MFMLGLILAGEAVFALPFHLTRFFRPTVLEVFNLTHTELGTAQAVYGFVAMIVYFPGGPLADRFSARKLLAFSRWSTAAGGGFRPARRQTRPHCKRVFQFDGFTTLISRRVYPCLNSEKGDLYFYPQPI